MVVGVSWAVRVCEEFVVTWFYKQGVKKKKVLLLERTRAKAGVWEGRSPCCFSVIEAQQAPSAVTSEECLLS